MTPYQTLVVCLRLLAIWWFIQVLGRVFMTWGNSAAQGADAETALWMAAFGLLTVPCLLLAIFPFFLARVLLSGTVTKVEEQAAASMETDRWFALGCSLIGVWALTKGVPALISYGVAIAASSTPSETLWGTHPDWTLHISFNVLQCLVGIWLLFGARGLGKAVRWARSY